MQCSNSERQLRGEVLHELKRTGHRARDIRGSSSPYLCFRVVLFFVPSVLCRRHRVVSKCSRRGVDEQEWRTSPQSSSRTRNRTTWWVARVQSRDQPTEARQPAAWSTSRPKEESQITQTVERIEIRSPIWVRPLDMSSSYKAWPTGTPRSLHMVG